MKAACRRWLGADPNRAIACKAAEGPGVADKAVLTYGRRKKGQALPGLAAQSERHITVAEV
jgi:hypothetical protein